MTKYLLTFAAFLSFAALPVVAQDESSSSDETTLSPEDAKAAKKAAKAKKDAAKAAKKLADMKKKRAKSKFKWYGNVKAGLKAAKAMNTTCLVVYTNPAMCSYCVMLDNEVFKNRKFKSAREIGVGVMTSSPLPEYGLGQGMPSAVILGPDGKKIGGTMGYSKQSDNLNNYLEALKAAQPEWEELEEGQESADGEE